MRRINVLSFEVANLIAAGEVVDRPASVVKELLENSIDAGATKITAEIRHGGISLIRVTDNGSGMSSEDLPLAIKRHATSKISDKSDLDSIITLGFRGEALAATAAVSELHIITKTKDAAMGTMLFATAGEIKEVSEVGCADGTSVVVEKLFFNVPARRKFLKKDATESLACLSAVSKVAMSHPEIAFEFISDGICRFSTAGDGKLINALYAIEGGEFAKKLICVDNDDRIVKVSGYIGRSDNIRGNRNYENTFINGRYVKSKTVMAALEQAYASYIAPGKFPVSALFIKINPAFVDVNVHPSKLEVKFSDEKMIFDSVYYAVKTALDTAIYRPEMILSQKKRDPTRSFIPIENPEQNKNGTKSQMTINMQSIQASHTMTPRQSIDLLSKYKNINNDCVQEKKTVDTVDTVDTVYEQKAVFRAIDPSEVHKDFPKSQPIVQTEPLKDLPTIADYKYIGELFNCYLIVELDSKVLLIDKHAAHERINFEEMKRTLLQDGRIASQNLMIPIAVNIGGLSETIMKEHRKEIEKTGFCFNIENGRAELTAIPDNISVSDAENTFTEMVDRLTDGTGNAEMTEKQRLEKNLYQIACKASIKGGRVYDEAHIKWLIEQILALPDITVCPHGRPIAIELTKTELDRQFDRIN